MDVGRYRYNYKGFYKKIYIPTIYKYGENNRNSRCSCKPCENYLISSISLLEKSFDEEINHHEIVWIPLEVRHLNSFKNSFKKTL